VIRQVSDLEDTDTLWSQETNPNAGSDLSRDDDVAQIAILLQRRDELAEARRQLAALSQRN